MLPFRLKFLVALLISYFRLSSIPAIASMFLITPAPWTRTTLYHQQSILSPGRNRSCFHTFRDVAFLGHDAISVDRSRCILVIVTIGCSPQLPSSFALTVARTLVTRCLQAAQVEPVAASGGLGVPSAGRCCGPSHRRPSLNADGERP